LNLKKKVPYSSNISKQYYKYYTLSCEWGNSILLCFICDTYATGSTHPQLRLNN
jgi:hypothetical protein